MNIFKTIPNYNKGFIFLEIVMAVAIFSIVFITLLGITFLSMQISSSVAKNNNADALAKEAIEAVRSFRDATTWGTNGLGTFETGNSNPYHFVLDTSTNPAVFTLAAGSEAVGGFTRYVVFDKVSRDLLTSNIEATYNASHDDPNTRKVTVTVVGTATYQFVTYLTNWR